MAWSARRARASSNLGTDSWPHPRQPQC